MRWLIAFFIAFPFVMYPQYKRIVSLEAGILAYTPFIKSYSSSGASYTYNYKTDYKYEDTYSPFMKVGLECVATEKKNFSFSFPYTIGLREQKQTITETGYAYGCFGWFNGTRKTTNRRYFASMIFGPKFNYNFKKITIFTALNLYTDLYFLRKTEVVESNEGRTSTYSNYHPVDSDFEDILFNLSLQNGIVYSFKSGFGIGLTEDIFFYNINHALNKDDKSRDHLFNFDYSPSSLISTTGVRLQYKF